MRELREIADELGPSTRLAFANLLRAWEAKRGR